jgi:hypothetical protein
MKPGSDAYVNPRDAGCQRLRTFGSPNFLVKSMKMHGGHPLMDFKETNTDILTSMQQALAQERKSRSPIHHALARL